jgi:hypothetical protein
MRPFTDLGLEIEGRTFVEGIVVSLAERID